MKSPLSPVILYCFTLTECLEEVQEFFLSIPYNNFFQIKISISLAQNFQIHSRDIKFYCDFFFSWFPSSYILEDKLTSMGFYFLRLLY